MTVKSFFLRYGLLVILFLMILGICVLFQTLSIRQKVHVQLFVTGPHTAVAYLSKEALSNTQTFVFFKVQPHVYISILIVLAKNQVSNV